MKYQIIYADPPWSYSSGLMTSKKVNGKHLFYKSDTTVGSGKYKSLMKTDEICALPIKKISHKDSMLFLWTTDAHIPDALKVIDAWGFKYKTVAFIWKKIEESGKQVCFMGAYTMKNCEIVLLATRGQMTKYLKSRKVRQLQEAQRDRNVIGKKPKLIREKIIEMLGDLPRIELFARQKTDGWHVWGNEVESDIELPPPINQPMNETKCCEKCRREKDTDYWIDDNTPVFDCIIGDCPCHQSEKPAPEGWEGVLAEEFFAGNNFTKEFEDTLKSFIRSLLAVQKKEIVEEIKAIKQNTLDHHEKEYLGCTRCCEIGGYNWAISDVSKLIEEKI